MSMLSIIANTVRKLRNLGWSDCAAGIQTIQQNKYYYEMRNMDFQLFIEWNTNTRKIWISIVDNSNEERFLYKSEWLSDILNLDY